jgi:Icc-related predicted phosphoesterase
VKVLFFTDVHSNEQALDWVAKRGKDYEAIVVGGDLARGGSQEFVSRFLHGALAAGRPVYYVQGNADAPETPLPEEVIPLHGLKSRLGRFSVGGLGGSSPTPFRTPFELTDEEARSVLDKLGRVEILVSHCPPKGTKCDKTPSGHVGSAPVREYVQRQKPVLVLSGHAHESRAVDNLSGTTVVNAGPLMEGKFAEVNLDRVISVELKAESLGDD